MELLYRGQCVHHGHALGRDKAKRFGRHRSVGLFAGECEMRQGAVGLFDLYRGDRAFRGNRQVEAADAFFLASRDTGKPVLTDCGGRDCELINLFLKLRMAQEKSQRRAQVVEFLGRDALHLRIALGIEPWQRREEA